MHDYFELLSTGVILALNGYLVYNYISLYIKEPPMLTYDDALNLNYYKKTTFTGSSVKIKADDINLPGETTESAVGFCDVIFPSS